jgi:DNA-directed RNA polymerase subunit beta
LFNLFHHVGSVDDIDILETAVSIRWGAAAESVPHRFSRMERVIRERMTIQDLDIVTHSPYQYSSVNAAIKEFFGSSPLSQFMDQNNPLAGLHISAACQHWVPGGLSRDRANFEVRDVHTALWRMCPIETPEGPNIRSFSRICQPMPV